MSKIFLFAVPTGQSSYGYTRDAEITGNTMGYAVAEDGEFLTKHLSSGVTWSKHDLGLTSDLKHDIYAKKYPNGYELEWIDYCALKFHEGFRKAYRLNEEQAAAYAIESLQAESAEKDKRIAELEAENARLRMERDAE